MHSRGPSEMLSYVSVTVTLKLTVAEFDCSLHLCSRTISPFGVFDLVGLPTQFIGDQ